MSPKIKSIKINITFNILKYTLHIQLCLLIRIANMCKCLTRSSQNTWVTPRIEKPRRMRIMSSIENKNWLVCMKHDNTIHILVSTYASQYSILVWVKKITCMFIISGWPSTHIFVCHYRYGYCNSSYLGIFNIRIVLSINWFSSKNH